MDNSKLTRLDRIEGLRRENGLTQKQLEERTGLSSSVLSTYENIEDKDISHRAIITLAEFYGVTTDYLQGLVEQKNHPDAGVLDLHLSDEMIDILRSGKFNNRLLCEIVTHSKFHYIQHLDTPKKDAGVAEMIRQCHRKCGRTYGYRSAKIWLEREKGICLNEKTVLRIMQSYGLLSEIRRRKGYRRACEHLHRYPNLLNRDFHAQRPNQKWVTDISYIQAGEGVLYLSMIRDLYDSSIVAYKTGTRHFVVHVKPGKSL